MFISVMLVGPPARVETLTPTGRICEKTDYVDLKKKKKNKKKTKIYQHVAISFKIDRKEHTVRGDKLFWLQTVRWLVWLPSLLA